jgi:hypothetical protein
MKAEVQPTVFILMDPRDPIAVERGLGVLVVPDDLGTGLPVVPSITDREDIEDWSAKTLREFIDGPDPVVNASGSADLPPVTAKGRVHIKEQP